MLMNVNYHYANGTAAKHTIDTFGNKTTVIDAPKQAAWIEFIDAKSGISPQKIITKRQGNDLLVYFEQGESEPDLIIKNYYDNDELPPILGVDSQGAYHAYVAELAQPELALDKLASGVTSAQILSSEAYNIAAFPWWHVGGIAAGLGLVGLVAGGGGSGGSNSSAKPEKVVFDPKPQGDGSVSFDLPDIPNNITRVDITYTPTGSTTPVVAVIEKDPTTGKYISRDPNVKVDPESGKVTIAEEHIQDGTDVSVVVTNDKGMSSDPATTTAGKDYADDTQLEQPVIKELTDKSDRADNNPEELIVEGKTEPLAEVTIKDKNGNVVGKGTADANGDYRIPVVERDKGDNDINSGDELTVIAKADGKNPTETKVTVPNAEDNGVTIKHTGDSVGPENPPVINKDPNTGETKIPFPDDNGDTKEVEIDYTPKGGDSTTPDHINVEKDKDGNVNVEYKPGDNEFPINIDRTSNPDGGSETGVTFTPENQDKPIKIEVEKDKDGNTTTTNVELTPEGKDKPINIEVKKDENGNIVVEIKDQDGKVIGGEDQLPDNVKVDGNGTVKIDTDGNKDTPADTVINSDGTISVPPGVTVKPDGNVEIDTDKNPGTKPIVIDPEGNVTIPDGATEPGTNIDATGKDLAGNPSDTNGVESTEPANPNPNGGTPLPPTLTAKEDGSVTVTLPTADKDGTAVKDGDKVVLTFDKEPAAGTTTAEKVKVTLVKDGNTWKVDPATTPADLVTVNNDGTVTIPERSVADASVVKAYSQGKGDSEAQKSATVQVTVLPDDVTKLNINSIHLSSHNDDSPAKLDDITEFTLTGYAGSTDPSAKVQVKFGDQVIGEGVADKDGGFALIFREPEGVTINAHDKLTIVATAPTKKPSTAQEKEVPEIVKDSTGYKNDEIAPEPPSVTVGKDGDNQVKITPKDPQPGDKIQISVVDNEGNTQEIIVNVDKDGNLVPENNPTAPTVTIKDGVIELDRTQIKNNTNIVVTAKDIAGNPSEPAIKNSGFDEVTANPTIDEIVAHDTDLQADKNPETFTISGTAPAGSKVIARDEQGNVIGETTANDDGKYQIEATEKDGVDINAGSKIYVTAQEVDGDGKPTKGESAVPAVGDVGVATTHENDKQPPQPADILDPKDNGDIDINLPEDAKPGDKATISVGNDTSGNGKLDPDEVKDSVTLEKGEDGKWKPIDGNKDLVKPTEDDNVVTIPSDKVPNDSTVKVETEDLAGNKTEVEDVVDNKLPQTAPPTDIRVTAKDEDNPADGKPDSITVKGKAEPNSIITVTLNGKEYTGQADNNGDFSLKVAAEDLKVGDSFEVKAQAPNKTPSEAATTDVNGNGLTVPKATEFADNVEPGKAEIGDKTNDGDIPVKLDENAQPGDQYTINVGKDTNGDGKLDPNEITGSVTLEKQEDGSWKPVSGNEDLVKKPIENNTALIPSDKVENGDKIKVVGKDNAGNTSEVEKTVGDNTPVVPPTEKTAAPVIDEIKAIDTDSVANNNPEKVIVKGSTDDPNTEIVIKDGDGNIIGQGKSSDTKNEQGKYPFEIEATELTGKDLTVDEKLTITATAEGKSESEAAKMRDNAETKVPAVENNHEGHPNDTQNPEVPTVLQKEGTDDAEVLLPKDAVTGDQVLISKDVNKDGVIDNNETTVIEKGADGNWTIKGDDPLNIGNGNIDNNNGKVTVPAEVGDKIFADSKDLAGNTSGDSVTISPVKEKSTAPMEVEISTVDTSNPADNHAEVINVKGKVPNAADGTKVIVYDPKGNILGEGTVQGGNGEFEFSVPNSTNLNAGDNLEIKALEKDKELSEAGSGKNGDTNLPEVPRTAAGHPNDPSGPSAPELVNVPKSGAVAVILPKDANPGDKVEVKFTDEKDQEQTVTLTKQADGSWTSDKEDVIPSVKDNLSQPQVVIPENTLKDGKEVSAKSIDGFVDGAEKEATPVTAGKDAKTNTPSPEDVKIEAIDKDLQADGNIDAIKVSGTTEPGSLVVIYQGDKEIGRKQLENGETQFSIEIGENAGEINVGDPIRIVAKAPGKDVSDPYDTLVPNGMTFLDKQAPQDTPTVEENIAKGEGDVKISVPKNPQEPFVSGDKLIVTYTDENDKEHTATLTYNGVGGWRSDDPNVPSIPKGQFSTTIAEDHLKDKSVVSAIFQDVASNKSDDGVATAGYDEITPTPTVDSIVGTDTDNDGNPETVVIKGKLLDESGKPLANVPITVTLENGTELVGTNPLILTNDKGEYEVTLTEGQNNVPSPLNKGTRFKVSAEQEGLKDRSDDEIVQAPAVTILEEKITVKGIDLDSHSNASPEQFSISGTSEKGAKVSAYITVNDKEVKIGEVNVDSTDGKFTLKTTALSDLNLGDFKYSVKDNAGDTKTPTAITLKAEKADQSPSPVRTTEAKRVDQGTGSDSDAALKAETFPNDTQPIGDNIRAKVTALPNGFGGARIELPKATDETFLEVTVSYPAKGVTGDNDTLTLTWDGAKWTSNKPDVIANPTEKDGKFIAYLAPDKVNEGTDDAKNSVTVITRDYAGNKSEEQTAQLNKPAGDYIADQNRTDPPSLDAGSDQNAGDLVAKPGSDNDELTLKFVDETGKDQTITIVKDSVAGEWNVTSENPTGATLDKTTGTITVPAAKVKDGSEAEAIGYKGKKPSTAEFKDANNLPTSVHVKVTANADDATPNEADAPTVTGYKDVQEGGENYQLKGGATVKVGGDNVEVMINAKGYVEVMTGADGSRHTSGLTVAPFKTTETPTDQGSTKVEEQEIIIRAQKDPATGEWTLQGTTKDEFDKAQTLTDEEKASIWNEIPSDIATVDKDGNITLKPNALVDNSAVSAKGYNAKHKESSEAKVDDIGAEPRDKDVDADEPKIPQTNRDGSMSITPGADNHKVKVTYTKGGKEQILEIEKDTTGANGVEWKVKGGGTLPENVTFLDKSTGKLHFPKGTVDVNTKMTAVGTNKDGYDSDSVSQPVLKDPTPFADAPQAVVDGDKVVVTPGADSEKVKITGTTNDPVTIVKGDNGEWKWENGTEPNGFKLDPKTGKVTINNDKIGQDGIIAEATDGYEPTPNTKQSNNGKPVKPIVVDDTADSTEPPVLTPIQDGEKQGAMTVKPKDDHVEVKVTYTDEQNNTGSITAVRDPQTGEWSLAPTVKTEEKNGEMVTTKEPIPPSRAVIDKVTGVITLMADELQDGKTVKAVAKDVKGNYSTEAEKNAANDPVGDEKLPEDQQPDVERPVEAETPTLFQNVAVGEVRIIPGKGVDSIKFNVGVKLPNSAEPVEYINYWLTKDDYGEWVAVAAKVTDKNGDGRLDDDNDDFAILEQSPEALALLSYDKDKGYFTLKDSADGARLSSALDSKVNPKDIEYKIFDIHLAREGEETLSKADIDGFTMMTNHKTETNTAIKAPLYHHVLSNGEALTSPIIEVVKEVQGTQTSTKLKITFDPDTYAMSFETGFYIVKANGVIEDWVNGLHIEKNINNNSEKGAYFSDEDDKRSDMVTVDPNNNNVVFVRPTNNVKFRYDVDGLHKDVTKIKYNVNKDDSNIKMKDFFGADDWGGGGNTISLPNVDLSKEDQTYTLPDPPKVENPTDAAEKVNTPTALVDEQHKGGVKVKPATSNSGTKYRVDYLGEDSTDAKVIMVKKGDNNQWQFESNGSTGTIDGTKIKLDASSGELTFAPEAVADGGRVTITAYDSKDTPRAAASVIAQDELPVVEIKQDETNTNIGGVVATPKEGVTKFQLNFTDEGRNNTSTLPKDHVLVYEKKGSNWELVSVDGDSSNKKIKINGEEKDLSQADNATIKLDANSGQVTFDKDAIGDKSTVTITPYSKRGTLAGGAAKSVQSAVDKLMTYLDESNVTEVKDVGKLDYVYIDAKHGYYRGLKQLLKGELNNSAPTPYQNAEHSENGRRLDFDDKANIVRIDTSINYTTYPRYQSGYNFDLDFDFKGGNDLLLVGNDVGTGGVDGNGRRVSNIQMGDGNDLFVVGAHNDWFYVVRHKENGTFDVVHWDKYQDIRDKKDPNWEDVGFYAGGKKGGQIRHTEIGMGDGDDTLLVLGVNGGNVADRATYDAIIDLGEGNNRLVVSQEIDAHKSIANSVVTAGSGVDVVKAGGIIEGSSISLGGGDDEVIVGRFDDSTIDLGDGNDWMEVTPMRGASAEIGGNAKVYLGNGNDVFKLGAKLNASDNSIIDGGNGSDFLLFDVSGAIISTTNFKNFEEIGFMQDHSTINIRAFEIAGLGTPLKVTQANGKEHNTVDFGLAGKGDSESGQNQEENGNKKYADVDHKYWAKSQSVTENGVNYDVYTYDNNSKIQVWVENTIEVI